MTRRVWLAVLLCVLPGLSWAASPAEFYAQQMRRAAVGETAQAAQALAAHARGLAEQDVWRARMRTAAALLTMRAQHARALPAMEAPSLQYRLAARFLQAHPAPRERKRWPVAVLAAVLPGLGHAWLGRWQDVKVVVLLVWPMLGLTLWAARRRMGPVTVFFAGITLWLWSGSVYSAISLHEREQLEQYLAWWQQLWAASALPGRPW